MIADLKGKTALVTGSTSGMNMVCIERAKPVADLLLNGFGDARRSCRREDIGVAEWAIMRPMSVTRHKCRDDRLRRTRIRRR